MKVLIRKLASGLDRLSPPASLVIGFMFLAVVVVADCTSPLLVTFTSFYVFGIAFLGWKAGLRPALAFGVIAILALMWRDWRFARSLSGEVWLVYLNVGSRIAVFGGVAWGSVKLASRTRNLSMVAEERMARLAKETEQHQTTSARLAEANERFLQVINNITEVFWLNDLPDFRVIYASPGYEKIWGRSVEDLYRNSKAWLEAIDPEDREEISRRVPRDQAAGRYDVEYRITRPDGSKRWIRDRAFPVRNAQGEVYRIAGIAEDITDQKGAERALARQEELYRTLFELCPDGILLEDTDGNILDVNNAICQALGYSRSELLGRNVRLLSPPENGKKLESHLAALRQGQSLEHEVWNVRKDGQHRLMRLNEKPLALPDGQRGILVVAADITERKRDELTREALLALGERLSAARAPAEAARAMFASADRLWEWHSATLDIYAPEFDRMEHVLNYDVVDGERREVPAIRFFMPPTPRMRRIMQSGPELILRPQGDSLLPNSVKFGDTARASASIMCVPLRRDGKRVGVLSIHSYTPNAFTQEDLAKLQALADHCGGALDRLRAEAALRESEERYRTLAESSPDAIFILDRDIKVQYVNSSAAAMWARQPKDLAGRSQADLFPPETARRQSGVVAKIFETGQIVRRDVEVPFPDGRRWLDTLLAPIRDAGGAVTSVMGISRDITERKRVEAALRESEERFRTLSAATFEGIIASRHGVILDCNDQIAAMLNCAPSDLIGHGAEEFVPPEQRDAALRHLRDRIEGIQEHELLRKDGTRCMVESHGKQLGDEGSIRVTAIRDITDRKRAEEALRRSEERYRSVVEDQTELIARFKPDGTLLFMNEAFCRFFGRTAGEVGCGKWQPNAAPEELPRIEAELKKLSPANPVVVIENTVFSRAGQRHWMQFSNRALFDDAGHLLEIQCVGRDMTERKRAEEALRESESKLSAVFRILPIGISTVSQDGKILDPNPALCRVLDVSPEVFTRREDLHWKFCRSDGAPLPPGEAPSQRAIRDQREVLNVEIGIEKENGVRRWVSVNAAPLPGIGAVVSTVDITERKRAEFLLRAQRDLAAGLSSTSDPKTAAERLLKVALQIEGIDSGCVSLLDAVTGNVDFTAHQGLSNFEPDQRVPRPEREIRAIEKGRSLYLEDASLLEPALQSPFPAGSRALAVIPLRHAGTVLGTMTLSTQAQQRFCPQARLIIETLANEAAGAIARIRAEEALHRSEARLRAFITSAPVLLFACDRDGNITLEDGLALKALGVEPGARVGQSVFEVFAHAPTLLDNVRRALQGEAFNAVVELESCALDCWYSPVRDKNGAVTGFNGVATNITERHRLERQILEISDREQARIGQDLHDGLCQQLAALAFDANSLQSDLARQGNPECQRAGRISGFLDQAITEARHVARGLFPVRLESEGLSPALQELANTTRSRFSVDCHFRSRGNVEVLNKAVATHIYRIAQEAVSNAIRHGNSHTIILALRGRAGELELQVSDDGVGLPPNRPDPARGMGLHIMDYRARAVGGTLRLLSPSKGGVIVSCCIPRPESQ